MALSRKKMREIVGGFPLLNYIFPVGITALIAALIYMYISKKCL